MTGTTQSAKGTKISGFKWLWVVVLAILATVALTIFFNAPLARRPGMAHYVAAHAGVFFSYMLFAVLIAAVIKYLTKSRWVWYDWANIVVVLATCIFIFRDYNPFPASATATAQPAPVPMRSRVPATTPTSSPDEKIVSILGKWQCRSSATDKVFVLSYEANGSMSMRSVALSTPMIGNYASWRVETVHQQPRATLVNGQIVWTVEDGNYLMHLQSDGVSNTRSRIVELTNDTLKTVVDAVEISCVRI